jgi:hypothetical protein
MKKMEKIKKIKKDYLKKLELKSNLKVKDKIEKIIIIQNKYLLVKSFNEIAVYLVDSKKLKFNISLNEEIKEIKEKNYIYEKRFNYYIKEFIFDYNFKLRIIIYEENKNFYNLLTDKHLIEVNFDKNEWKIINTIKEGIYLFNLDVLIGDKILDQNGKLKKQIEELKEPYENVKNYPKLYGLYEIKEKYLIINSQYLFLILDINNNYEKLYSKENTIYPWAYKPPFILNEQTIVFSAILNPYIPNGYDFIFLDLDNFSKKSIGSYFNDDDYESINKLFIIHKFENNIYLQMENRGKDKKWSIVKKDRKRFSCIKSLDDKKLLGNNLNFTLNNLIISWDFEGTNIKFIKYE